MPVDPNIKKILDQITHVMPSSMEEVDPVEFRELTKTYEKMLSSDVSVKETRELEIPAGDSKLNARYYSEDPTSNSLIVFYHGGGFVIGDVESYDSICKLVSKLSGSKVISVGYRLAPEYRFPTAVNDAYSSYRWIRQNADSFGVERGRIAVMGDSAGGNLCAALSVKSIEEGFPVPALSVLFYPVLVSDISSESFREYSEDYLLTKELMRWFQKNYITNDLDVISPYFSPMLFRNLEGMPETIVVTAEFDPLRDQGETFVNTLKRNAVKATGIRATGMIHGFLSYVGVSESAKDVLMMLSAFIGLKLRQK